MEKKQQQEIDSYNLESFKKQAVEKESGILLGKNVFVILLVGTLLFLVLKKTTFFSIWCGGLKYCFLTISPLFLALFLSLYLVVSEKVLFFKITEEKLKKKVKTLIKNQKEQLRNDTIQADVKKEKIKQLEKLERLL